MLKIKLFAALFYEQQQLKDNRQSIEKLNRHSYTKSVIMNIITTSGLMQEYDLYLAERNYK